MTKIADAAKYLKKHGFFQFSKRIFHRLGFVSYDRTLKFFKLDFAKIPLDSKLLHRVTIASEDDIKSETAYFDSWFSKEDAIKRLQNGHRLFFLREDQQIVCYYWIEQNHVRIQYLDLHFNIPKDTIYIMGIYTPPEARGKAIPFHINMEILQHLKKEGFKAAFLITHPTNLASIRLLAKSVFQEYQTVNYRRHWYLRIYRVTSSELGQTRTYVGGFKAANAVWKAFF